MTQITLPGCDEGAEVFFSHFRNSNILITRNEIIAWDKWPINVKELFLNKLNIDKKAIASVAHFKDEDDKLFEFVKCRYGALNRKPDIINGILTDSTEYFDCGIRGKCQYEGKRCHKVRVSFGIVGRREIEVIKLIAQGLQRKEIAEKLFISTHTVKTHIQNIKFKLNVRSTEEITAFAFKRQIINY